MSLSYEFLNECSFEVGAEYSELTENYENFYGYNSRQYKAKLDLRLIERNRTEISFRFKDKNYPNYWTSRIGIKNRDFTDYADFEFDNTFEISPNIGIVLFLHNYNKVSNEPTLEYSDLTAGAGVSYGY